MAHDDGRSAAANWTGVAGRIALSFAGHGAEINSVSFDAGGRRMLTAAGDATAKVWDLVTGEMALEVSRPGDIIQSAHFDAAGERIVTASTYLGAIDVWNASDGTRLLR